MPESSVCACSIVEQPPLNGTKIALWVYLQSGVQCRALESGLFEVSHGAYRHLWGGSACNRAANSEYQTRLLLNDYILQLIAQEGIWPRTAFVPGFCTECRCELCRSGKSP